MMQALRNNMKHIMLIVLLAFLATIIFSWGMGGFKNNSPLAKGIIGKINGQEIDYRNYMTAVNQQLESFRQQSGAKEITEYQRSAIRDQVWNSLIQNVLFSDEIQRLGLKASPDEIVFQMRNNPPDFVRSSAQFQTDGKFDWVKYHQALSQQENYSAWIPLENYLRSVIPMQKLQQRVIGTVQISDTEVLEAYEEENDKVKAEIIFFNPDVLSSENIVVTDNEIKGYYKEHLDEYQTEENRKIKYVLFPQIASAEDSARVLDDANYILKELKDGADFKEFAETYSDDQGTASSGGDLGFFGKDEMVAPFSEAVFAARPGDIIGPVKTQYGLHIIEVLASKREDGEKKMHARHILLKYEASNETIDNLFSKAQYLSDEAHQSKSDFSSISAEEGYEVKESPYFTKRAFIPGIGMSARMAFLVFSNKPGYVSDPMQVGDNTLVFSVDSVKKAGTTPLADVRDALEQRLLRDKKVEKAHTLCAELYDNIKAGMDFRQAATEDSVQVITTDFFALKANIPRVGRDPELNGAAFRLNTGDISEPILSSKGAYLVKLLEKMPFDAKLYEKAYAEKRNTLLQEKQRQAYNAWFENLKEKANIEDYREQYY